MTDFAQTVDAAMGPWRLGWIVWDAAYYVTGILIIALPAIMSADLVRHERGKRILAAATAILAGVVTWVQPGTKATAHEQAYFCLRQLEADHPANWQAQFHHCSDFINYPYLGAVPPPSPTNPS